MAQKLRKSKITLDNMTLLQATHTIVIPVSNPDTAPPLLNLAEKLITGEQGRIILLSVITEDDRQGERKIDTFRDMVETHYPGEKPYSIELVSRHARTIAGGILEVTRHYNASMILIGLNYSIRGQVELGRIVETVIAEAPCNVGVYRSPYHAYVEQVVIPVGGSIASKVILDIGIQLSHAEQVPCQALHVYSRTAEIEAREHVANLLASIPGYEDVTINLVHGVNAGDSVLSRTTVNDLMVIGYSGRNPLEKWLYGNTSQRILDRASGSVLMVSRAIDDKEVQAMSKRRLSCLRPLLTENEQDHIIWMAKDTVLPNLDYFILLIVAALLASLGLLLNSSAIVIGAMLVAPLMQPIIALGIGLCTARLGLMRRAVVTICLSILVVLGVGYLTGLLINPDTATDEILGRAYPSLLDAVVALASGFIGAYATARKDIPAALAGVAIAAALVPPICTVGLGLALVEPRLAMGAGLLFIANLVSITVSGAGVFFWMGMRPTRLSNRTRRIRYVGVILVIICSMLIVGAALNFTDQPGLESISEQQIETIFAPAELRDLQIMRGGELQEYLEVVATLRTSEDIPPEAVRMAQVKLSEDLKTPVQLRIVIQRIILAGSLIEQNMP